MHRASLASGAARRLAKEFRHHRPSRNAPRQRVAVLAVGTGDVVVRSKNCEAADRHGLLSDVEMAEPTDLPQAVGLTSLLLEAADEHHLTQPAAVLVGLGRIQSAGPDPAACGGRTGHRALDPSGRAARACSQAWYDDRVSGLDST